MIALLEAVKEVGEFLDSEDWQFMVIGGLAVQIWGRVRTTQDADISVGIDRDERERLVEQAGKRFKLIPEDPKEFITKTNVLPLQTALGIDVDLICAWTDMEREAIRRVKDVEIDPGFSMRVCSAEDLVVMKFISDRPRDREDVEGILIRSGEEMDHDYVREWLRQFAETLNKTDLIKEYDGYLTKATV